jgi:hypothetical protein
LIAFQAQQLAKRRQGRAIETGVCLQFVQVLGVARGGSLGRVIDGFEKVGINGAIGDEAELQLVGEGTGSEILLKRCISLGESFQRFFQPAWRPRFGGVLRGVLELDVADARRIRDIFAAVILGDIDQLFASLYDISHNRFSS